MIKAGCILEAHHRLPKSLEKEDNEPLDSPAALERLEKWGVEHRKAHIITIEISEEQALKIIRRMGHKGLLGATCGKGFLIENDEHAAAVNEVLSPKVHINFNLEKHRWMIQTWPE